jgi:hypothetical protein
MTMRESYTGHHHRQRGAVMGAGAHDAAPEVSYGARKFIGA